MPIPGISHQRPAIRCADYQSPNSAPSWTLIFLPGSRPVRSDHFLITGLITDSDPWIRKTSLLRDRSNGTRGQAAPACAPFALPPCCDPIRIAQWRANAKAPGVCEPSSIFIKGGLGTISSSRCQTTRARPGEPGRARIFSNFWTSSARARRQAPIWLALISRDRSGSDRPDADAQRRSAIANLVEPDGIEPTTSCLQSRRSPN